MSASCLLASDCLISSREGWPSASASVGSARAAAIAMWRACKAVRVHSFIRNLQVRWCPRKGCGDDAGRRVSEKTPRNCCTDHVADIANDGLLIWAAVRIPLYPWGFTARTMTRSRQPSLAEATKYFRDTDQRARGVPRGKHRAQGV